MRLRVKYWEIIADNLKKAGRSYGYVSAVDSQGRTMWIADAHRDHGKRFVVRADEKLTAFLELESAIREASGKLQKEVFVERRAILRCQQSRDSFGETYEKSSSVSVCFGAWCCLFCSGASFGLLLPWTVLPI